MSYQPITPPEIAAILRGEAPCGNNGRNLLELGRIYYQDGKDGLPYETTPAPDSFNPRAVELVETFSIACWKLGQADRAEKSEGGVIH